MGSKIKIIHKDCDVSLSKDKSLPIDSYLVTYSSDDATVHDIVQGVQVDIFDHYYDKYNNIISIKWTEGQVNPKLYGYQKKSSKK